ncbi:MAG: tagaturonate reductase, partial [Bacteroidales bacterium]|nr:tagaturonate reductase [Bacteroidales bacterium]
CRLDDRPASSYPGKLTQLLYHRFKTFKGDPGKGWLIFPCELIFHNGTELNAAILRYIEHWELGSEFENWYKTACGVYSTLVDRIVPGYPKDSIDSILDRIQLDDKLVVQAEIFHLWVIEAPAWVEKEFPASKAGLNVLFVPSEKPYHDRKVTLLNGPHSALAPVAYLAGLNTVRESVEHETVGRFVDKVVFGELLKTLDLPESELRKFANDVLDRFRNPFVKHFVTSIMLNAFPKFKTRDIPGLKVYQQRFGELPAGLVLGLAAIITYYKGGVRADGAAIVPNDDAAIVELLGRLWAGGDIAAVAQGVLAAEMIWNEDLNAVPGLTTLLTRLLTSIQEMGMMKTIGLVVNS